MGFVSAIKDSCRLICVLPPLSFIAGYASAESILVACRENVKICPDVFPKLTARPARLVRMALEQIGEAVLLQ